MTIRDDGERIDWSEINQRLQRATSGLREALAQDAVDESQVLSERAKKLAEQNEEAGPTRKGRSNLAFDVGDRACAVDVGCVRRVVALEHYAPVPHTPDFVAGVLGYRGDLFPLFDLEAFFGFSTSGIYDYPWALIIGRDEAEIAILATEVDGVLQVETSDLVRTEADSRKTHRRHIRGATREGRLIIDAASLLDAPELYLGEDDG